MTVLGVRQKIKSYVKARLPRGANLGPAMVQLFLNNERNTRLSLINFPAFLAPKEAGEYAYWVRVYDADGREVDETRLVIPLFGAIEVNLSEAFSTTLPDYGMVAVRIEPLNSFFLGDRHLGRIRPHFFTLYADPAMNSMGLIHPQTSLDAPSDSAHRWVSNLQIEPRYVRMLEVYQINPSRQALDSQVFLQDPTGIELASEQASIPTHGTRRATFDLGSFENRCERISVGLRGLAAANGKPILFMHFHDGSFTCCHG